MWFTEAFCKVLSAFFVGALDSKIVNYQAELCSIVFVMEEAMGVFCLVMSVSFNVLDKTVIGCFACVREATHSLPNFNTCKAIFDFVMQIVFFNDFVGHVFNWHFHALAF